MDTDQVQKEYRQAHWRQHAMQGCRSSRRGRLSRRGVFLGGSMLLVGVMLLLQNLNILFIDFKVVGPVTLIAIGAVLLVRSLASQHWLHTGSRP